MKASLILAGASLVAAQYFPGEPDCAIPCLTSAITKAGCDLNDVQCQCGPKQTAIAGNAAACLIGGCSPADLAQAQSAGLAVCSSLSEGKLTIPATATTTGDAATTTDSDASTTITGAPGSSGASSGAASTTGTATETTEAASTTGTTSESAGKTITNPVVSSTAVPSAISGSSTSRTTNAAPTQGAAKVIGGVLAGVLGVAAVL
ncbi:hypothetical protein JX265_000554 [Neoarthrinium moseri]|uniref:CFEM domain-containing protein n=1 Tax=Neoarthrinium moseri TaxID=1658444 RepID=A0A9Q0ASC3_9PEZI|nr:uncharacterized protein JN550_001693 [Neoarthrinium moseri]KAI1854151.1 hypothetical protein JX266_001292 [Neoarthrinium moseri]KAI1876197.1 hypothetical protein JN550_001693 [Neoarthrinium moseri]KAI1881728.1 hypothetical protein JX265_000554 [Neoarthrinium moseri]